MEVPVASCEEGRKGRFLRVMPESLQFNNPEVHHVFKEEGGKRELLFVVLYKPPHKLPTRYLNVALRGMDIDKDFFSRETALLKVRDSDDETRSGTGHPRKKMELQPSGVDKSAAIKGRPGYDAEQLVASVDVQKFHYMIENGPSYSYATTGLAFIFFHIRYEDPTTLYYYLSIPSQDQDHIPIKYTASGQVAGLALVAFRGRGQQSQAWRQDTQLRLQNYSPDTFDNIRLQNIPASAERKSQRQIRLLLQVSKFIDSMKMMSRITVVEPTRPRI